MNKEILFISHESTRTGAVILLLSFLRWFKENTDIPFRIILRESGELESEFAKLAPTLVLEQKVSNGFYVRIKRRLARYFSTYRLRQWLIGINIRLIYSNTITNGTLLESLKFLNCPVISHAHELEYVIQYFGIQGFEKTKRQTNHFIACADAVKKNLIENHHIIPQDITVIHGFIPISSTPINPLNNKKLLEKELNLPPKTFIVGASATTGWRKGPDLFIQLASIVKRKAEDKPIKFVWIGGKCEEIGRAHV